MIEFLKFMGVVALLGIVIVANIAWITLIVWAAGHFALGAW